MAVSAFQGWLLPWAGPHGGAHKESPLSGSSLETPVVTFASIVPATVQAHSHCPELVADSGQVCQTHVPGLQEARRSTGFFFFF